MLGLLVFIFVVFNLPWILGGIMSLFAAVMPVIIVVMIICELLGYFSEKK